jgi:CubicO group peptidase (beta-lactamase class C family)
LHFNCISHATITLERVMRIVRAAASVSLAALLLAGTSRGAAGTPHDFPDARATDPTALGWMVGSPPPPEKIIRYEDGSYYRFPQWRWSFSHMREFRPTIEVARGSGPPQQLASAERSDLDAVTFVPLGGADPMTWAASLAANYTDGIVILHRGRIVYERYFGALTRDRPHIAFSVTKSFFGTIAAMLVAEGALKPDEKVARYIPELANSGFGDATVAQVLDMTTAVDFTENYADPSPIFLTYRRATGFLPRTTESEGPKSIYAFLATLPKKGAHGQAFTYRTPNTDVIGWLIARATGKSPAAVLSERIWSRIGADDKAFLTVDADGVPLVGSGLNARVLDFARFGELMRLSGHFNGQQIVPAAVVQEIRRGGSRELFAKADWSTLPGWSYHHYWWVSHDDHGVFAARGLHGQTIYVDPKAEMVIARFASHPLGRNTSIDPTSLPAYRAIAEHLLRRPE